MAGYNYVAMNRQGKKVNGAIEAKDESDLRRQLKSQGLAVVSIKKGKGIGAKKKAGFLKNRITSYDITLVTRQMATMLESGIALLKVITILEKQADTPKLKEIFTNLKNDISQGQTLSSSLAKHPKYFDKLYINMVKAGEASGALDLVLKRLAHSKEEAEELKGKVKGAMVYPIIVISISLIIVWGLLTFVVPTFAKMFEDAGMKMPPLTEFVMNVANFMHTYWYAVVGIVGLGIFLLVRTVKTPKGKEFFDKKILKVPLMGPLMRIVAVARFTRTMSTLLSSGVPILVAFDIAAETCGNTLISKAVFVARDSIKEGNTIAQPLEASGEFPLMVTQMIEVGEESGTITEMLDKVSDFLESDIRRLLTMVVAAMEPFAIVLMAVMVGTIVIAMFLPMFDIADAVSK